MLISHRKKFIYTKTVKTAGTSVESYFEKYCMPEGEWKFSHAREMHVSSAGVVGYRGATHEGNEWFNHMSAHSIRSRAGSDVWDQYFKFCIVRNPYDKVISAFYYFSLPTLLNVTDSDVVEYFRSWISSGNAETVVDRDKYLIDGDVCVDYFIRYECIASGVKHVCNCLNIPYSSIDLPRLKVSDRHRDLKISDYYDRATSEIVEKIFEFELKYFDYSLDS